MDLFAGMKVVQKKDTSNVSQNEIKDNSNLVED